MISIVLCVRVETVRTRVNAVPADGQTAMTYADYLSRRAIAVIRFSSDTRIAVAVVATRIAADIHVDLDTNIYNVKHAKVC
jgi:hypothetical protein